MKKLALFIACALAFHQASPQDTLSFLEPSPVRDPDRVRLVSYALAGTWAASAVGLYQLWYKDYDLESFHFFDDRQEWMQFDKAGHIGSAYYLGKWGIGLFEWTGMRERKAAWLGGMTGWAFLASVEVFDGFSSAWGFSWSDMAYNTGGTALLISQQLLWHEQRVTLRFSHHGSEFAAYRPDQFGSGYPERLFKDYNGSTVWLSANVRSFLGEGPGWIPSWLSISAGYGVEGLTGARENVSSWDGRSVPAFERARQYYVSLDVDLSRIPTRSGLLRTLFGVVGFIKFPAPAVEFNSAEGTRFHWIYF
jgi:uncharacterized protein YfiM (DUF2279 family)